VLAVFGNDHEATVWDTGRRGDERLLSLDGHTGLVRCVSELWNRHVVTGSDDNTLRVYEVERTSGTCIGTLKGHRGIVRCVAELGDGRVVSGGNDKT
jgi:WD40 repeat protein